MDNQTLQAVTSELAPILEKRSLGKIFQIARGTLVIDFRPGDGRYLLLNFEPHSTPRLYLARRRVRDLEKESAHTGNFAQFARKRLADARLVKIIKDESDRIVRFQFLAEDQESSEITKLSFVAQFTGRTANLFLLDGENRILASLRETNDNEQVYQPPQSDKNSETSRQTLLETVQNIELPPSDFEFSPASPLSAKLDAYFTDLEQARDSTIKINSARGKIRQDLNKKEKLLSKLQHDLVKHGDAAELKKSGDLLLANAHTARRANGKIVVIDYFDENAGEIEIDGDENLSLPEAAEKFFARYAKARNAAQELTARIASLESEILDLKTKQETLEKIVSESNESELNEFLEQNRLTAKSKQFDEPNQPKKKEVAVPSGTRRYRSSDGFEILVGRSSKDNDYLTTRVAKSLDWWLHAADYPGSHVVVRNPSRGELPPRTLLEAAQLAAKFSSAREDTKVAVNYTQRKFVSKPKNAAPGLVRLASFRTILVEPKEAGERIL